jgi:fucose 4-O-acetylase-like acetyltransferase
MIEDIHPLNKPLTKSNPKTTRIGYIDVAKGIGITLVVMGHNDFSLISPFAHKLIYSFHMPMFFFMSGMFFKPDGTFWAFARRRFDRVLRPFLFTLLLIYFVSISFSKVGIIVATRRLLKALYGSGHYLDWVQLWFLPHLFVVSIFAYVFIQAISRTRLFPLRWLILAAIYVIGVLRITLFWPFEFNLFGKEFILYGLPYSLDIVFVSGVIFILGFELNKKVPASLLDNPFVLLLSGLLLIVLVWYAPSTIDFNIRQFDSLFINTLEAILGIIFILALSKQLERIGWASSLFRYIGQASLIILVFQVPIQDYWGQKIIAITDNLPFSYWLSFLAGVLGPIIIHAVFIRPNPILRKWFSQPAPQEISQKAVSVFE